MTKPGWLPGTWLTSPNWCHNSSATSSLQHQLYSTPASCGHTNVTFWCDQARNLISTMLRRPVPLTQVTNVFSVTAFDATWHEHTTNGFTKSSTGWGRNSSQVPCLKMWTVAPSASVVHAGLTQAEQTVVFRSVCNRQSTQTHTTDQSKHRFPADSMTGREAGQEGMYDAPPSSFLLLVCFYKSLMRFC